MKLFLDAARQGGLLFDGATGTLLYQRGVFLTRCFEEVCLSQPELVAQLHEAYMEAGARVLTTNSFGANRTRLERHELAQKVAEINEAAARIALKTAAGRAYVAGSVGPTGLDLDAGHGEASQRARYALEEQIDLLAGAGVHAICLETFYTLDELLQAVEIARARSDLPVVAQLTFRPDGLSDGGLKPLEVGRRLLDAGAHVIGTNCGGGPDLIYRVATPMVALGAPVVAQANAGRPEVIEGRMIYVATAEYFGVFARRLLKAGVKVIGGCCGTRPEHIRHMSGAARMMAADEGGAPIPHISGGDVVRDPVSGNEVPLAERSDLARKVAAGDFVVSVEVNAPLGFDLDKQIRAARALQDFGVTTINIADGPRASLRMSNLAMALRVQRDTDLEPILHVCCRDRSFLGLQSDLLGAHVLGIRNLVVITGDPPKMGDYPHSTGVYDLDSVGLLRVISGYNNGVDPAGKEMAERTRFFCLTGAEPAAADYERELRRLELKKQAGASAVMTQPVYDPETVDRFLHDTTPLGLPILLGVCPLASYRNAIFLHENIPGMQIPKVVRERMRAADAAGRGREEGVAIAREALAGARDRVQGVYILPPFGRHKAAMAVLEGFI